MGRGRGNTELTLLYLRLTCFLIGLVTSNLGEREGEGRGNTELTLLYFLLTCFLIGLVTSNLGEGEHRVNITVLTFDLFLDWFSHI